MDKMSKMDKRALEFSKKIELVNHIVLAVLVLAEIVSWLAFRETIPGSTLECAMAAIGLSDGAYMIKSSIENKAKIEANPDPEQIPVRGAASRGEFGAACRGEFGAGDI